MKKMKIFIACPISKYLTDDGMERSFENFIKEVYKTCKRYSDNVFMALYREQYGLARMEDEVCTPLDYKEMLDANYVIAIPEDSMGVAVELGWASAMKKNILLIMNTKYKASPLINALGTVANVEKITVPPQKGYNEVQAELIKSIEMYLDCPENEMKFA